MAFTKARSYIWSLGSLLNWLNGNCDILLVSRFEFTGIMTTSFQLQSHKVVSYQHSISCIKTLSVGFPALCLLLHNRSIGRKVQTRELDIVDETVALHALKKRWKSVLTKCNGMVVDIFQNDTRQCMRNFERFAIFNEEKVRLICWHFFAFSKRDENPFQFWHFAFAKTKIQLI